MTTFRISSDFPFSFFGVCRVCTVRSHDLSIVSLVKNAKCGVRMTFGMRSKTAMLSSVTQLLEKFLAVATLGSRSEQKQQNMGVSGGWEGMGKLVLRLEELS